MGDLSTSVTPRLALGRFPTRVERLANFLPRGVELWIKREDESASLYGGNKVRKLEFLLGEARAKGHRRVITYGGLGSHHVTATALHGRAAGFEVEAILFPQAIDDHVRELLRVVEASGAELTMVPSLAAVLPAALRARLRDDAIWLAGGGSSVTGTLGWVSGAREILSQVTAGELARFDAVYAALGSGGTVAGLLHGLAAADWPIEVVAVRVVDAWMCGERTVRRLARAVGARLRSTENGRTRLRVETRHAGRYGVPTADSLAETRRAAAFGLALEPIYTGKVMAALVADARAGRLDGRRVLFLHSASR
jgi:1-aminocyclopropane-1-carboxylate deaminase/D-cysteine desulfhydrase-like pyridoxal-dependent ACC family enzyme